MFKNFSRIFALLIVFMFGSVVAVSASAVDIDYQTDAGSKRVWENPSTFQHYVKVYFGKWSNTWFKQNHKQDKQYNSKPVEQNNNQVEEKSQEQSTKPKEENNKANIEEVPEQEQSVDELSNFEQQVIELTNEERSKAGLAPLQADWELNRVAKEKSRDMSVNNYFSHNSPVYGSPFDMIRAYGINYRAAGENIAKGQRTPQEVVQAWMNSPGHRANILNSSFTHIGVGYVEQGNHWTQMFIGK